MLKRFANLIFRAAYGETLWAHDEALKREWLSKGWERGHTANRTGCPFNLYLVRSDLTPEEQARANLPFTPSDGPKYRWWGCIDMATGGEAMLGDVGSLRYGLQTPQEALERYLELLPDDMRRMAEPGFLSAKDRKGGG